MSTATGTATENIAQAPIAKVGQPAPDFNMPSTKNIDTLAENVKLADYKGKWLILLFYPLDFTFVCPTEIIAFSDRIDEFEKLGAKVIGASVDSHFTHLAWKNTPRNQGGLGEIKYPLLSDLNKEAACKYRVLLGNGVAARGIFIIDDKGILQTYTVNNLGVGRSVDETLRLIQAYQFVAKHGEVCPANWKPGEKTMKPDPVGSKEYFQTVK